LKRSRDFTLVIRRGGCAADGMLVVFAMAQRQPGVPRLGVTIPKRTGTAVRRNRWKRLIREAFRTQKRSIPPGYDLVVRPKRGAEPDWEVIRGSLPRLARKAIRRAGRPGSR
jgi:ribonuclease P protein component